MYSGKFKVGDKVIIIGKDSYFDRVRNSIMLVTRVKSHRQDWHYDIDSDDSDDEMCAGEEELEFYIKPGTQLEFEFMKA